MSTQTTPQPGTRALVTGASSGIGAAMARELAALGVDLVLTARRRDALDEVAATCTGVKVEIVIADLGKPDTVPALWRAANTSGPIDILINNAGFGYFRRFDEVDWARDAELIQLNMTSLVALSRCFVDAHKNSSKPSHLMNIASTGAYQAVPNMALYAASKAFVRNFSEALHDEHRGTPLSVTCICPGGTETAFHAASGGGDYSWIANASTKSAGFVAHAAIRGMLRGQRTLVPGLFNKLSCFGVRFLTRRFASRVATQVLGKPRLALPARKGN
ncbi:SDR family oxidoreductase [Acidovorax sp. SUPP2539]|uniref:SDR family NAD(P)-dependent oxidoreductase n=1 Tax=Acidovorax sp. SUPP2539 TaxID=2920878 RepID=UPI0023DE4CD0|nr:SDR family oxidoreductase [Acidovorax sp. SUPP2539]GKS88567.1 SDR family oxidoreductase [Acidovorax sp. SUPP2539]